AAHRARTGPLGLDHGRSGDDRPVRRCHGRSPVDSRGRRAGRREMPGGKTIAHGYLTLSLIPRMAAKLLEISRRSRGINYGSNKIRFISPVPAGSRIRLRQRILGADEVPSDGIRVTSEMTVEVEGQERPALVAEL